MNKNEVRERFEKNRQLVDFHYIPDKFVESFYRKVLNKLLKEI